MISGGSAMTKPTSTLKQLDIIRQVENAGKFHLHYQKYDELWKLYELGWGCLKIAATLKGS
jgi:hypothetical protein